LWAGARARRQAACRKHALFPAQALALLLFKGFRAFRVPALAGKSLTYGFGFLPPEPAKARIQRTTKPVIIASLLCLVNPLY